MSIINQMLRDLDARQASSQERAGLPSGLRALPPEPRRRAQPWMLLAIGLIVGAVAVWFITSQTVPPAVTPTEKTAASQPAPAPADLPAAPAESPPVAAEPAFSPPPALAAAAVATAPTPHSTPPPAANAKPALAEKPQAPVSAPTAKTIAPPSPASIGEKARQAAPAAEPVEAKATAPDTGEARIDKQPKTPPTRERAETEYRKGMQAASQGDPAAALPALRRALELDPHHAKARQALLAVLANGRQWEEVKRVAQAGLELEPTRTGWAMLLARLQYEEGAVEAALQTLEKHAAHAANDADFHALHAFLLQKRRHHAEAAQHYQAALRLRPDEGRWWYGLGLALEAAGRAEEARMAFVKAREAGNLPAVMQGD
ncbi:MAG: tetratricopeptide repeat protein, partial [Rhodocyclaceae bacterium]